MRTKQGEISPWSFLSKILEMVIAFFFTGLAERDWLCVTHLAFLPNIGKWIKIDIKYSGPFHLEILLIYYDIPINYTIIMLKY